MHIYFTFVTTCVYSVVTTEEKHQHNENGLFLFFFFIIFRD